MTPIRLLLADDHTLVRQGLIALLSQRSDWQVVGEAADGPTTLTLVETLAPDVVLLDVMMPGLNGLEVARQLASRPQRPRLIFLSMHASLTYVVRALRNGASGYVLKDADFSEITGAVEAALQGRIYLSRALGVDAQTVLSTMPVDQPGTLASLSPREREILQWIVEGLTNGAIADKLGLSIRTVETHRAHLIAKLHVSSTAELIRLAMQQGLVG